MSAINDLSSPGDILAESLEERGVSIVDLARSTGVSEEQLAQIVHSRAPLTVDVASALERVLGIPATLWMSLEVNYRAPGG